MPTNETCPECAQDWRLTAEPCPSCRTIRMAAAQKRNRLVASKRKKADFEAKRLQRAKAALDNALMELDGRYPEIESDILDAEVQLVERALEIAAQAGWSKEDVEEAFAVEADDL